MVTSVVAATEGGQGEEKKADTNGAGLEASKDAETSLRGRLEKPEERKQSQPGRQLKPEPKPKVNPAPTPTARTTSTPMAVTTSVPTPVRRWETVQPRNQKQSANPAPALTSGSSLEDRPIILRRDENVPLHNKMDQEIVTAINRALFHQPAPAHISIFNASMNAKGAITAITHQITIAAVPPQYRDIFITAARTVDKGVVDVKGNESWERLKIHAVPLVR